MTLGSEVYVFPFSKPEVIECLILSERNVFSRIVWLRTDIHVYGIYWNHWLCMVKLDWLPSFIYRVRVSCSNRQGSKSNGVIYSKYWTTRQRRRRDVEVKILESFLVYSSFKHVYKHNTQTKIQGISFLFFIPFFFCLSLFHYIFHFFLKIKREGGFSKDRQLMISFTLYLQFLGNHIWCIWELGRSLYKTNSKIIHLTASCIYVDYIFPTNSIRMN